MRKQKALITLKPEIVIVLKVLMRQAGFKNVRENRAANCVSGMLRGTECRFRNIAHFQNVIRSLENQRRVAAERQRLSMQLTPSQKRQAQKDLAMLNGLPPYGGASNICCGDGYFAQSLVERYGMPLEQLAAACGHDERLRQWQKCRRNFSRT